MFFNALDLTTALRPSLLPDETLLFVQDQVGLYEGKYKIPNYQSGHAYLTSHRICYVDDDQPRKYSVALELKYVDRVEYQAGFLKSSPKITIYPKPSKRGPGQNRNSTGSSITPQGTRSGSPGNPSSPLVRSGSPFHSQSASAVRIANATWVCPICTYSNPVPSNFDPATANASMTLPSCLACGIKPPFTTILKAAIASASASNHGATSTSSTLSSSLGSQHDSSRPGRNGDFLSPLNPSHFPSSSSTDSGIACPRCTFANHPSLLECEICGAPLKRLDHTTSVQTPDRSGSPAPLFGTTNLDNAEIYETVKLSFRGGGEKIFHERLRSALVQRKWLLCDAPPVPRATPSPASSMAGGDPNAPGQRAPRPAVGIAGLERRGLETRQNNQVVLGSAFEDLEALMASAKEIVALAESFAAESGLASNGGGSSEANTVLSQSAAALGMATTKDMLGSGGGSGTLYLSELSRNLAEYLTDDRKGILHREGGIMSLIDLWAVFNRSRNGVELVSPADFQKAAELWEKLKLPVRLRRFKSGLLVVQRFDWTDEKTIRQLKAWLEELRSTPLSDEVVTWDWRMYGRGVTAQEAAERFGWSVGVAAEELEMAEDKGVLCREEGIEGLRFWSNYIIDMDSFEGMGVVGIGPSFSQLSV
ncbi:ESCRT-II complex subunit VPS36 [[Emmonsia] crescens]|uniref:Vacuolar protein-sorting-associated protein 36 n=1 Tax=[Emmonsia] crescens TaxID=73230 RepID=A0A2B7ZDV6_9EURO|nr:ESCRT-II complex subunit VPS36 [Emmonsia crescens]